jgi:hypothetical protein
VDHIKGFTAEGKVADVTVVSQATLFIAVVTSPSTAKLALECGMDVSYTELQRAAGRLADAETLHILRRAHMPWSVLVTLGAVLSGSLPRLRWFVDQLHAPLHSDLTSNAAKFGQMEILAWLHSRGCRITLNTMIGAVQCVTPQHRQWQMIEYLHIVHGCPWHENLCRAAARVGNFKILKQLRAHGCPWDSQTVAAYAAETCDLDMFRWLLQQPDVVFDAYTMAIAAGVGHLEPVQFLLAEGCLMDSKVLPMAVKGCHIEIVHWLHEHGCPWDIELSCTTAAETGSIELMAFTLDIAQAEYDDTSDELDEQYIADILTEMLNAAGSSSKLEAAQWLRYERGAQWPAYLTHFDLENDILLWESETLKWARNEWCTSPVEHELDD